MTLTTYGALGLIFDPCGLIIKKNSKKAAFKIKTCVITGWLLCGGSLSGMYRSGLAKHLAGTLYATWAAGVILKMYILRQVWLKNLT